MATLSTENGHTVRLKTDRNGPFTEAIDIAVVGSGYMTESEAQEDGELAVGCHAGTGAQ